jgi:hypothetical protein
MARAEVRQGCGHGIAKLTDRYHTETDGLLIIQELAGASRRLPLELQATSLKRQLVIVNHDGL